MKPEQNPRNAALLSLGTAVPTYRMDQMQLCAWMSESLDASPPLQRWLERLYRVSGIETRYASIPDGLLPPNEARYAPGHPENPTTAERMAIYERESVGLGTNAARCALENYAEVSGLSVAEIADSITHLIVVSCTGFFAPGPDLLIARALGLRETVGRTLVGFMGCAAAFNGLRLADYIVRATPDARVLVICVEICSVHLQPGTKQVDMVVGSLFADGAAAALVGVPLPDQGDAFELRKFYTRVKPQTERDMVWQIGDRGFLLHLSPQVPDELAEVAPSAVQEVSDGSEQLQFWAIHPGGRGIVDRLGELFQLSPDQLESSRAILRDYGNLSSPTVLFVLHDIQQRLRQTARMSHNGQVVEGVAMAFGPGLVAELAYLHYLPNHRGNHHVQQP